MLLTFLWFGLVFLSLISDIFTGTPFNSSRAALSGAAGGLELALTIAGPVCLWSGAARIMERAGLTQKLCRVLHPLLRRLFPVCAGDAEGFSNLCGNLAANLLGLGNAATPLGVAAARRMQALSGCEAASDELCRLVVLNTASIQLLPTTVAALRASLGAPRPFVILPAVWCASVTSVAAGLAAAQLLRHGWPT